MIEIKIKPGCGDVLPVSLGSGIVLEKVCVLDKDHDGHHRDKYGNVWVNTTWQDKRFQEK